jgi:MFS family permease
MTAASSIMQEKRSEDDHSPAGLTNGTSPPTRDVPAQPLASDVPATAPPAGPSPPPNGGLTAWLHVLGSFMLYFNTWGIMNAFGVYQNYYESGELFQTTSSNISWVGSIEAFLLLAMGIIAGPIYDRGYMRSILIFGTFMVVFGHMMLSLCHEYWQVVLAQGFVVGIGTGFLFVPCVAIVPQYFSTKLGMALGIAVSGSALGGIIYPVVLFRLINDIGFAWAVRVMGFIALGTLMISISVLRMRVKPPKVRKAVDVTAFTDLYYVAFVFVTLVAYMGLFVIFFYLPYYAEAERITDRELATYLVPVFNAASLFGRTLPNIAADKFGPMNLLAPASMMSGVLMLCMIAVHSKGAIIVVALLSGFMSGALIGLPPLCFIALTKDKSTLGTRIGQGYALAGLGILASGPSAGAILGVSGNLDWTGLWTFGGVCTLAAGIMYGVVRVSRHGFAVVKA